MPPKLTALGYAEVAIVVGDLKRAVAFYIDVVGYQTTSHDVGPRAKILKVGPNNYLGLWEPGAWRSDYFDGKYGDRFGLSVLQAHLVFAVAATDIGPLKQRLESAGHPTVGPNTHADGSPHLYVIDPDGHPMEFWGK